MTFLFYYSLNKKINERFYKNSLNENNKYNNSFIIMFDTLKIDIYTI